MQKRILGRTNLEVSIIGLGGIYLPKVPEVAEDIIRQSLISGINIIDTALLYGESENIIGNVVTEDEAILITKSLATDRKSLLQDIDKSRKQLNVSTIDIYMLHNVMTEEQFDKSVDKGELLRALYQAREEKKIRYLGVSSHRKEYLIDLIQTNEFDVVELPFNVIDKDVWLDVLIKATEKNLGTVAMKPLAGGIFNFLSTKLTSIALQFVLQYPLSTVAIGMRSIDEVIQNSTTAEFFKYLNNEDIDLLTDTVSRLGKSFCRQCDYCVSCPNLVPISNIFTLWKQYVYSNMQKISKERYNALKVNSTNCTKCGKCERKCPYELPIRDLLVEVDTILRNT
jgi:predicted aldo/keto reductase-like oxidoreductase